MVDSYSTEEDDSEIEIYLTSTYADFEESSFTEMLCIDCCQTHLMSKGYHELATTYDASALSGESFKAASRY